MAFSYIHPLDGLKTHSSFKSVPLKVVLVMGTVIATTVGRNPLEEME